MGSPPNHLDTSRAFLLLIPLLIKCPPHAGIGATVNLEDRITQRSVRPTRALEQRKRVAILVRLCMSAPRGHWSNWEIIRDLLKKHDLTDYGVYRRVEEVLAEREPDTPAVDDLLN